MNTLVKGFLGVVAVIAAVASLGGYGYAQAVPTPLIARMPNTNNYALMNLKINAQCTQQMTDVIAGTIRTATTKKSTYTERDIIELMSRHTSACVASGTFPSDIGRAKLYYQYTGSGFAVRVSDGFSVADVSPCMGVGMAAAAVYAGTEDAITTTNSVKFSMMYNNAIGVFVNGTASADGFNIILSGFTKENINLPKLNSRGQQTLTDSWTLTGQGVGTAYALTVPYRVHCTATVHGNGSLKR